MDSLSFRRPVAIALCLAGVVAAGLIVQSQAPSADLILSKGKVVTVERAVDPTTGTLGIELEFPNDEQLLRPGQYGRVRVLLDTKAGALLVPQRAVQELQNLYSVAVVDDGGTVAFRNVKVRVLKNFPSEGELRSVLPATLNVEPLQYYWLAEYRL